MPEETKTDGERLTYMGTDAQLWAQEFINVSNELIDRGSDTLDEGWLIGWFAAAIQTGDAAGRQYAISRVCTCTIEPPFHDTRCPAHSIVFGWPEPAKNPAHKNVMSTSSD